MTAALYARILGASYDRLAPILRDIHDARASKRYVGRCGIFGGTSLIGRIIARLVGLPIANNDVPVAVIIVRDGSSETWTRTFGTQRLSSRLTDSDRLDRALPRVAGGA